MPRDLAELPIADLDWRLEQGAERLHNARTKRVFDLFLATLGSAFLLPFLLLVAVAIRLESPGPALFRQRRTGYDGVTFTIYKFRTMCVLEDDHDVVAAVRGDCRTTRWGSFLRRSSIDELPQLLNVLRGEMSLVGPRPHAVAHDCYYSPLVAGYVDRFLAKPGITGLAQVSGHRGEIRHLSQMRSRVALDLEYIRTWSLWLDTVILARTLLLGPFDPAAF